MSNHIQSAVTMQLALMICINWSEIHIVWINILAVICEFGQVCMPLTRPQNKTQWDNSSVWMSAGRPVNCELHSVMKRSKNQYHNSVRRVKNLADTIRSSKLSDAALSGNKQLFQDWKKSNLLTIKQLQTMWMQLLVYTVRTRKLWNWKTTLRLKL